jgi:GntR family transcriptional regulator
MADPLYRRIAEDLRQRIASGELAPGTQLPTELELREQYQASRNTVRDAVKSLINRRLVTTRPGQGTFVVDRILPFTITMSTDPKTGLGGGEGVAYMAEVRALSREPTATPPRVEVQPASDLVVRELQLESGADVVSRHQQLRIDGKPWSLQTSFYPMKFVEMGATQLVRAANIEPGAVRYVMKLLKLEQGSYQDKITARPPNEGEAAFFKFPDEGTAVMMETIRTSYERSGQPIRCTITVWSADRVKLAYNIGEVPTETTDQAANGQVAEDSESAAG